ncbi:spinster family MFS transporter [Caldimonas tepidiphila]|uniref:spinster family MFS transporter n=1 Tax=Caldimonas tepidiphila TaxID=2315841 RepID=UPI000E5ABE2C|nr:MFS transporter [Caldimonas tepidiphila]
MQHDVSWRTHLTLALLALVYIFSYIDRQVVAILIEPIKSEFGASDTHMGLLSGLAFGLLYATLGVPVGKLADKYNRRNIVAVCCAMWSLATLACGMAAQFWQLVLARMSVAIGEAGGMAPSISMVSDLYPKQRRSLAISLFMMGPHFGVLIGLALGGWIAQQYGWRATFVFFGAPGLLLALLLWLLAPEPQRGRFDAAAPAPVSASSESLARQVTRLLALPAFRNLALACGIAGVAGYGYAVWAPSFLVRSYGLSIAQAGLLFGVASGVGAVAGALFSGWLCDRLVQRDIRWQLGLPLAGVAISLPLALGFFLWPGEGQWMLGGLRIPHTMVFALGFGFFASWWPSLSYSAISHMVDASERSVAAALLNFFITLFGVGAGPLVTGMLSDWLTPLHGPEALRYALLCAMSLLLLTLLFMALAIEPYRHRVSRLGGLAPTAS